jgi:hypothetical protein
MASCATAQTREIPAEVDVKSLVESFKDSAAAQTGDAARMGASSPEPVSGAYHTAYHVFGPDEIPLMVSVPANTDQEIGAIIWLCDESTLGSSVFDFGVYPAVYKEKYIIAVMPYKFKSGDVRVKNIKNSVGDIVNFVKVIAGDYQIDLNRIILVGYTAGFFSMAYL